ncbi:MAG: aquaporin family protein [Planctomycetes bacterium]|nr:aquaporin family protein [Planctomycetota bacterium]
MNEALGEFLGTMTLIVLGGGVVAACLLEKSKAQNAGWLVIATGWALAVMCGVYVAKAAGAPGYINPVGPVVGLINQKLAFDKAALFIAAELAGAFVGAVVVWLHYLPHWAVTSDPGAKLAVFATGPAIRDLPANVRSEIIATFVLVFVGTALDRAAPAVFGAPLGGALVWSIGLSLGATTGYALNPARDLGPRLAHAVLPIAGKGGSDWGYAWVPIIGPLVGGALGALVAKAVIV